MKDGPRRIVDADSRFWSAAAARKLPAVEISSTSNTMMRTSYCRSALRAAYVVDIASHRGTRQR